MIFQRKGEQNVLFLENRNIPLLTFPALSALGFVKHGFTTRQGGVSEGIFATMNLSSHRGDDPAAVRENLRRIAEALDIGTDRFVFTDQTHTTNVRLVTEEDAGKGLIKPQDYSDTDGLITNVSGVMLTAFFADCVPLFFADPVRKAVGLSHSGWKGTVRRMGAVTIERMKEAFGTDPSDLVCAIGPSICQDCYEVSGDVADAFAVEFRDHTGEILIDKHNGKYQLDLWRSNRIVLEEAGVRPENISVTDICTCCNPDLLFSHRASKGKRGNLGAG